MRGGKRPGAGRPKGSHMTKTAALVGKLSDDGITPLELILNVMRDETQPIQTRLNCAIAAAHYVHPRLAQVQVERKSNSELLQRLMERARNDGRLPPLIEQKSVEIIPAVTAEPLSSPSL